MPFLSKKDELNEYSPDTLRFWRDVAVLFCAMSIIGHWLEIGYCWCMLTFFGIYDPNSLVWVDPMYPFMVYGIGSTVATIMLVPMKDTLILHRRTLWGAALSFFIYTVLICMLMELAMGLMLNQPNAAGEYPLWDNSHLPGNILGQAWIVNDVCLGALAMFYVWIIYPLGEKAIRHTHDQIMNPLAIIIVVSFIALCIVKFS